MNTNNSANDSVNNTVNTSVNTSASDSANNSTGTQKGNHTDNKEDTNWCQSVGGVVLKGNEVLLVRHTYGAGKGRLIIPGGYVKRNETPQDALRREVLEETTVVAEPSKLLGVRFNLKDWYAVFLMDYMFGTPNSDNRENSEAIFMDINEAVKAPDVPDLTRVILQGVIDNRDNALGNIPFVSREKNGEYSFYGI
ncbi:MAG: ADP-ribose pyrophosphatase [Eubacterium sp.]|nr:ADP-ribose pyrophosphatase [Eubacterium sp.]